VLKVPLNANYRVATHPKNLEKSGNLKVVREKSGKIGKVRGD